MTSGKAEQDGDYVFGDDSPTPETTIDTTNDMDMDDTEVGNSTQMTIQAAFATQADRPKPTEGSSDGFIEVKSKRKSKKNKKNKKQKTAKNIQDVHQVYIEDSNHRIKSDMEALPGVLRTRPMSRKRLLITVESKETADELCAKGYRNEICDRRTIKMWIKKPNV